MQGCAECRAMRISEQVRLTAADFFAMQSHWKMMSSGAFKDKPYRNALAFYARSLQNLIVRTTLKPSMLKSKGIAASIKLGYSSNSLIIYDSTTLHHIV